MGTRTIPQERLVLSDQERAMAFCTIEQFRSRLETKPRPKRGSVNARNKVGGYSR